MVSICVYIDICSGVHVCVKAIDQWRGLPLLLFTSLLLFNFIV